MTTSNTRVTVRMTEQMRDDLERLAEASDVSVSELIKSFIRLGILMQGKRGVS